MALRFAKAYPVVLLARKPESYDDLVAEITKSGGKAIGISTDASDPASITSAFASIKKELPDSKLAAAVFNVGGGFGIKPFLETSVEELQTSLASNPYVSLPCDLWFRGPGSHRPDKQRSVGLYNFAKSALPLLLESVDSAPHPPSLLVTGATAAFRGSARFGLFAAGKFAKRALAQSLAREFGPKGVHVAFINIDGIIDIPRLTDWPANDGAPDGKIDPAAVSGSLVLPLSALVLTGSLDCRQLLVSAHAATVCLYAGT